MKMMQGGTNVIDAQLLVLKTAVEKSSFSEAARCLHISQPAISQQIHALEDYFNVKLFDRSRKKLALTEAGQLLYRYAVQLHDLYETARNDITDLTDTVKGRLVVGATFTIGEYVLPRIAGMFVKENPLVNISLKVANTEKIVSMTEEQTIDIGLIEGPADLTDLAVDHLTNDELVVIIPANHMWSKRKYITLEEFSTQPIICRESGSGTRKVLEEYLEEAGFCTDSLHRIMEIGSAQAIKESVEAGLGIAAISRWSVRKEVRHNTLKELLIKNMPLKREFRVINHKNKFRTKTTKSFLSFLKSDAVQHFLNK
jgi:DNA-binding transcriptional LysR family regulator